MPTEVIERLIKRLAVRIPLGVAGVIVFEPAADPILQLLATRIDIGHIVDRVHGLIAFVLCPGLRIFQAHDQAGIVGRPPDGFDQRLDIGQRAVSQKEWRACVTAGSCPPKTGTARTRAVTGVTWEEAVGYTQWLSRTTGSQARPNGN